MHPISVLVVEDSELAARPICRTLLEVTHDVRLVATAADARLALGDSRFDAIIADIGLPDGSGLDLVGAAKDRHPKIHALIVSGDVDRERMLVAHRLGAAFLMKPIERREVTRFAMRVHAALRPDTKLGKISAKVDAWTAAYELTVVEQEILRLAAGGVPRRNLAAERAVHPDTVKRQIGSLLSRTGDESLDEAVARLLREALDD